MLSDRMELPSLKHTQNYEIEMSKRGRKNSNFTANDIVCRLYAQAVLSACYFGSSHGLCAVPCMVLLFSLLVLYSVVFVLSFFGGLALIHLSLDVCIFFDLNANSG